jgi:hypothetical protein
MSFFLEDALFLNLVFDIILLLFACRVFGKSFNINFLIASVVGAIGLLAVKLIILPPYWIIIFKATIGGFMAYVCENRDARKFLLFYMLFLAFALCFEGGVNLLSKVLDYRLSLLAFVLGVMIVAYILNILINSFTTRKRINNFVYDIKIVVDGAEFEARGFLDSGNMLKKNGKAIVILSKKLFLEIFPDIKHYDIYLNTLALHIPRGDYIKYNTIGGAHKIFVFSPDAFFVAGEERRNILLGVSQNELKIDENCEALLNLAVI